MREGVDLQYERFRVSDAMRLTMAVWCALIGCAGTARWLGLEGAALLGSLSGLALVSLPFVTGHLPIRWARLCPRAGEVLPWTAIGAATTALGLCGLALAAGRPLGEIGASSHEGQLMDPGPMLILSTVLVSPVYEEILYRGILLPALESRAGTGRAIVYSSVLFAIPHVTVAAVIGALAGGLLLGWLAARRGSIGICIAVHAGVNCTAMSVGIAPDLLPLILAAGVAGAIMLWASSARLRTAW